MPRAKQAAPAGAEPAQGTPVEPAAPAGAVELVRDEAGRYGLQVEPDHVIWLGRPVRCGLRLRRVG